MNQLLAEILRASIGQPLTPEIAADLMLAADQIPELIPLDVIERIKPAQYQEFAFAVERIEDIMEEIKPLHRAHWDETESHRHDLPFNPDYETFIRYERAGRYVLFTLRREGELLGDCAMYLDKSAHTQTIIATEDTLYLLPEARKGRVARHFVAYAENAMRLIGAREINITVKTANKAARFFRLLGCSKASASITSSASASPKACNGPSSAMPAGLLWRQGWNKARRMVLVRQSIKRKTAPGKTLSLFADDRIFRAGVMVRW